MGACALAAFAEDARADDAPIDEVTVRGARHDAGETSMRAAEVRQVPGAFGDPFRVVETMPGVTPMASGLPYFFVRGAPPGNTGYFLDGIRVPLLFHIALGPSVVHPGIVDRVDFYPGGYPAQFGRFAGGIVTADTRAPSHELRAEGNVRLFDAGALVETPLADGQATVLAAARYSYSGLALSLTSPRTRLDYWDYQGRATWRVGPDDELGVFAFGSHDFLGESSSDGQTDTQFASQFHRLDVRWDHALGRTGKLRVAATIGVDQTSTESSDMVRDQMAAVRLELENRLSREVRLRAGVDAVFDAYDLPEQTSATPTPDQRTQLRFPPRDELGLGARVDLVWRLAPRVEIVPGVRFDLFETHRFDHPYVLPPGIYPYFTPPTFRTAGATPSVDPRFAVRAGLSDRVTYVSTFGVAHQRPSLVVPIPGLQPGRVEGGLQTSLQTSQGLEIQLPGEITAIPTAFLHDYLDMTDLTATCPHLDSTGNVVDDCANARVKGRSYGLELLVRRSLTKRVTGWLSYTLSRTTREAHPLGGSGPVQTVPGEFDRTHVLSLVGAVDLGRAWRAGGRFVFYSGRPYSEQIKGIAVPPFNAERLPSFYRLDVRLEKRWAIGSRGAWIAAVLEGLNVTLQKEAVEASCSGVTPCTPKYVGPITIPSLGVEASM